MLKFEILDAIEQATGELQTLKGKVQSGRDPYTFGMNAPSEFWTKEDEQERRERIVRFAHEEVERICEELLKAFTKYYGKIR